MKHIQIILILITLSISSCEAIRERRDMCPTYLTLEFSEIPNEVKSAVILLQYEDGSIVKGVIPSTELLSKYEMAIPRGEPTLAVYGNISNMVYNQGYIAQEGDPIDSIYTFFTKGIYREDLCREIVSLKKDYIQVHVKVLCLGEESPEVSLNFRGGCVGYSNEGDIIHGSFTHTPSPSHRPSLAAPYYIFNSRVSRQDKDITLSLSATSDGGIKGALSHFSLSQKLSESGMALHSISMDDIFITIDYSNSTISFNLDDFAEMGLAEIEF